MNATVTPVCDSVFVQALIDLLECFCQRENKGLTRLLCDEDLLTISAIITEINEDNLCILLIRLSETLNRLGEVKVRAVIENSRSLREISYFLSNLRENPLEPLQELDQVLELKIALLDRRATAIEALSC